MATVTSRPRLANSWCRFVRETSARHSPQSAFDLRRHVADASTAAS
jgi:hypothetical protein